MAEPKIAFPGEPGAYAEEALRALHGREVEAVPHPSFRAVFEAVGRGAVDGGVVPLENSLAGAVGESWDLLAEQALPLTGEVILRIRHCLAAVPGEPLETLERVVSHPQALAQCQASLRARGLAPVPGSNTAAAAKRLSEERPPRTAVLASRNAAARYGLQVLVEGMEDAPHNFTRFGALGFVPEQDGGAWKTSLVVTLEPRPSALHALLGCFAREEVDLLRLDARAGDGPWTYRFFLDVEGRADALPLSRALEEAQRHSRSLQALGSYRSGATHGAPPRSSSR